MREPLRVLLVEDSEDDALFTLRALSQTFHVTHERVETEEAMKAALQGKQWDIVISDFSMPHFSGPDAFLVLKASRLTMPFILVSGMVGEENAVEAMRIGVDDYILKNNLTRLVPAISRELQRIQVQNVRRKAEEERDLFFATSMDMLCIAGTDGYLKRVNPSFERILGYTAEQLLARPMVDICHPEDIPRTLEAMGSIAGGATVNEFECRLFCKDGSIKWLSWNGRLGSGGIYASARDVTEQREVDQTLRSAAERQEAVATLGQFALQGASLVQVYGRAVELCAAILKSDLCAVFSLLPDDVTLQLQSSFGWSKEQMGAKFRVGEFHVGYTMSANVPVIIEDLKRETRFIPSQRMIETGICSGMSVIIQGIEDQYGVITVHSRQLNRYAQKDVSFLQAIANVIATVVERSRFEAQLNSSDRMATVGQMAAGVAHEINNPLSYVTANLEMISTDLDSPELAMKSEKSESILEMLRQAQDGIERIRVVVKDLTTFSRSSEDKLETLELDKVIEASIRMASNEIRHRARLAKNFGCAPLVQASAGRLGQVILNLLINATQSFHEGGMDKNEIRVSLSTDARGNAVIEVTDTGAGIAPDVLPSVFDPFFTTKPIGVGTGLGLSICRNLVLKMRGELKIESTLAVGTTVRILLPPAADQVKSAPVISEIRPSAVTKGERRLKILLVDDERLLVEAIGRGLSKAHDVVTTTSPAGALSMTDGGGEPFDVIFCDLMMEEMTGMDFYDELRRRHPGFESKIIFMTGGAFTERARVFLETVPNLILAKPFNLSEICALLRTDLALAPPL